MISYATEDNEDTEPIIEKTYQDNIIPLLQGELLILRLPSLPSHQFWNKKLITLLILYSQSPKILKQS
jgi:hypothetical protein